MLDNLSQGLRSTIEKISKMSLVDKKEVDEIIREIQRSLISADVNVKLVFDLSKRIKEKAFEDLPPGTSRKEYLIKLIYDELTNIVGKEPAEIKLEKQKILLIGLFGSGKTTTSAKLAKFYQKKGLKPGLICCDTYRPAAYQQLKQLSEKIGVPFYGEEDEKDASKVVENGLDALEKKTDVVIVDSAGRNALDKVLVEEITKINKTLNPDEKILVIPADIGQSAQSQAREFESILGIDSIIVTKLDSTARAGGALTAANETKAKIKFVTVGEKPEDIEFYDPKRFVSRLIGMGDITSLIEKAESSIDKKSAEKMKSGQFDLNDFLEQLESVNKVGSFQQILDMMGMSKLMNKMPENTLNVQEEKMKKWKHIANSLTPDEKSNPDILNYSRIKRISSGAGVNESEVRDMIKSYKKSKKMMKKMNPKKMQQMAKRGGFGSLFGKMK